MANVKKDSLSPLMNDDQTDRIVGVKNSDASEKLFVYTDGSSGAIAIVGGLTVTPNASAPTSNVTIGPSAGAALQSGGTDNVLIGLRAGDAITDGDQNICIGTDAGGLLTNQSHFIAIGQGAFQSYNQSANANNVGIGRFAFQALQNGASNVGLGINAGWFRGAGTEVLATANSCVYIGASSRANADSMTNEIVIGASAIGNGSNTTTIGNSSTTGTFITGTATSLFAIAGDTMRIVGTRTPASNAAGTAGDFAFGTDGGTTYLYYCIASGNWGRVALTTGY